MAFFLRATLAGLLTLGLASGLSAASTGPESPATSRPLTEADRDLIQAAAHFATAETLYAKGELAGALRYYQRAWRWDPNAVQPLEKIVPLAFSLGRIDEAVRYTQLNADAATAPLLRRLALYLSEQNDWPAALRLYRLWDEKTPPAAGQGDQAARLLVKLEIGRLEYLVDEVDAASKTFGFIQRALLEEGADRKLRQSVYRSLGGSPGGLWEVFGRCHFDAGALPLAREAFEQMERSPDASPRAAYWLAETAAAEGKPLVAYDRLKTYFAAGDDPLGDAPYRLLNRVLTKLNDRRGLTADLQRLAGESRAEAVAALAEAAAEDGDTKRAYRVYRSLLTGSPDLAQRAAGWIIRHLAAEDELIRLANLLPVMGETLDDFSPLDETLDAALSDSDSAGLLLRLRAWQEGTQPAGALGAAAWVARRAGSLPLAENLHQARLAKSAGDAPGLALAWAIDLLMEDHYRAAAASLRAGMEAGLWDEDDASPHFYQATAFALADEHDAALAAAQEAAQRAPDTADIVARVGWVLYNAEREEEAIAAYEDLIEVFDDDPDPATRETLRDARQSLSYLILQREKVDEAAELLEQVLDEFPNDPGALNDLAYLWAARDLYLARAQRMAERAVAAEPETSAYLDTLAWTQYRSGSADAALATIERAIELERADSPTGEADGPTGEADGELLDHWGDILNALGRTGDAQKAWRLAAKQFGETDAEQAAKVRAKLDSQESAGE